MDVDSSSSAGENEYENVLRAQNSSQALRIWIEPGSKVIHQALRWKAVIPWVYANKQRFVRQFTLSTWFSKTRKERHEDITRLVPFVDVPDLYVTLECKISNFEVIKSFVLTYDLDDVERLIDTTIHYATRAHFFLNWAASKWRDTETSVLVRWTIGSGEVPDHEDDHPRLEDMEDAETALERHNALGAYLRFIPYEDQGLLFWRYVRDGTPHGISPMRFLYVFLRNAGHDVLYAIARLRGAQGMQLILARFPDCHELLDKPLDALDGYLESEFRPFPGLMHERPALVALGWSPKALAALDSYTSSEYSEMNNDADRDSAEKARLLNEAMLLEGSPRCGPGTVLWRGDYREDDPEEEDSASKERNTGIRFTSTSLSPATAAVFALGGGTGEGPVRKILRTDGFVPNAYGLQKFFVRADALPFAPGSSGEQEIILPRHLSISFLKWELRTEVDHVFIVQVYEILGRRNASTQRATKTQRLFGRIEQVGCDVCKEQPAKLKANKVPGLQVCSALCYQRAKIEGWACTVDKDGLATVRKIERHGVSEAGVDAWKLVYTRSGGIAGRVDTITLFSNGVAFYGADHSKPIQLIGNPEHVHRWALNAAKAPKHSPGERDGMYHTLHLFNREGQEMVSKEVTGRDIPLHLQLVQWQVSLPNTDRRKDEDILPDPRGWSLVKQERGGFAGVNKTITIYGNGDREALDMKRNDKRMHLDPVPDPERYFWDAIRAEPVAMPKGFDVLSHFVTVYDDRGRMRETEKRVGGWPQ